MNRVKLGHLVRDAAITAVLCAAVALKDGALAELLLLSGAPVQVWPLLAFFFLNSRVFFFLFFFCCIAGHR